MEVPSWSSWIEKLIRTARPAKTISPERPKSAKPRRVYPYDKPRRDHTRQQPRFNESLESNLERMAAARDKRHRRQARNLAAPHGFTVPVCAVCDGPIAYDPESGVCGRCQHGD